MGHKVSTDLPGGQKGSQSVAAETRLLLGISFHLNEKDSLNSEHLKQKLIEATKQVEKKSNIRWMDCNFHFMEKREVFFPIQHFDEDFILVNSESVDEQIIQITEQLEMPVQVITARLKRIVVRLNKTLPQGTDSARVVCECSSTFRS